MTAMTDVFENALALLLFNNTAFANFGDATGLRATTSAGSLYLALWIGDPTDADSGGAEASYTGYARVAIARSGSGFTVSANTVTNAAALEFGACTGGTLGTITHGAICTASSGDNMILKAALSSTIVLASGIVPQVPAGDLDLTLD